MDYLVKDEKLELKHAPGKGAWTYHIQIPNTKHLVGRWGSLKVSGFIDNYKLEAKNLFTITGQDKLISINDTIRKAIHKNAGDTVTVTLYLVTSKAQLTEKEILEAFKESEVLNLFLNLPEDKRAGIIDNIKAQKTEDKQVKAIVNHIDQLLKQP